VSLHTVDARANALYRHAVQPAERLADLRDIQGDTRTTIRDYLLATTAKARAALRQQTHDADTQLDGGIAAYLRAGGSQLGTRQALMTTFLQRRGVFRQVRDRGRQGLLPSTQ
jgi:hypothetical protein